MRAHPRRPCTQALMLFFFPFTHQFGAPPLPGSLASLVPSIMITISYDPFTNWANCVLERGVGWIVSNIISTAHGTCSRDVAEVRLVRCVYSGPNGRP